MKNAETNAAKRGVSLWSLAENAAQQSFNYIMKTIEKHGALKDKTFTVLCGKGMNGGDGILIANLLKEAGVPFVCVFTGNAPHEGLAREIYSAFAQTLTVTSYSGNEQNVKHALRNSNVIIDCVFGTGFNGELDASTGELFRFIGTLSSIKFSIDLPSGYDADTGQRAECAFVPDFTLVLGAYKVGLLSHPNRDLCGECVLLDIGLTAEDFPEYEAVFTSSAILKYLPKREKSSHKGSYGRLLNVAGSERYIGAALLSTKAAIKAGAGLVTLAAPERVITAIAGHVPEAVFVSPAVKSLEQEIKVACAVSIGCGLGDCTEAREARKMTEFVIKHSTCPIVLDADGINSIVDNIDVLKTGRPIIITPHPGEFSRLTGLTVEEIQKNRISYAKIFAKEAGVIVVLKGVNTVIAEPDGRVYVNTTGNAGLAKAGTGDVLTGIIGALAAQRVEPFYAAILGVYLHGLSADELSKTRTLSSITASEIIDHIN